ncbi:MAG: multicopper oxidase domain-containing protein [Balneolaceae bacterium]|nr:multicopper oxidase domain-containing protein [Balneolaceae bacterium]MBO6546300.1 multicopper oxidase domain-containing protein [Balneolaceae bacterium]MBO6648659.1 multicopper oxidase domain-containing protein [Balneolaceae bacterium]
MKFVYLFLSSFLISLSLNAQELVPVIKGDSIIYHLTIDYQTVNFTGKDVQAMTINNGIPGPTLWFQEGKHAVIKVTNKMDVETSVHWHGLLLPNYMDGVAYLTTPPIRPGKTLIYDFPLIHSGTYWYHSHTGLQEQRGIYGSIVIEPKEQNLEYDHDLVLLLSDWTDDNPNHVMKNLKRHNDWYSVKIGSAPSLLKSIQERTLRSQFKLWSMKMPGMHISDIPYDAFLINGAEEQIYNHFKPGEKVRVRVINAGASTYFWLNIGGGHFNIVSADGIDVQPVHAPKVLIGLAETYDFIVEIEKGKSFEFRATAQDVTGSASAFLGRGDKVYAEDIPFPDYQQMGAQMAEMHSDDGHDMSLEANETGIMTKLDHSAMQMEEMDHSKMNHEEGVKSENHSGHDMSSMNQTAEAMDHEGHSMNADPTAPMDMWNTGYSNSVLKAKEKTTIHSGDSLRSLTFNLTGNMWRYTWSINGKELSASDKIKIKKGEVVRITLNNATMMHHPMHLHGHFFRVLNGQGEYSPIKHTVDVPPMSRITIEFEANEEKDWFFHCHVLYHMKTGMARVISYEDSERDQRLAPYPYAMINMMDKKWYTWGTFEGASQYGSLSLTHSNTNNQLNLMAEYGWNENYEFTLDYERFTGEYLRVFGGLKSENESKNTFDEHDLVVRTGFRYLLWYIMDTQFSVDHKLRPEIELDTHIPLTQRLILNGHFEGKTNFGIIEEPHSEDIEFEITFNAGLEYLLSKNFAFIGSYDNRFGAGGGISWRF